MATSALIVVDMLNDFIDAQGALYCGPDAEAIVPFVHSRVAAFRKAGDKVLYLQDSHTPDDKEFAKFPPHCVKGTWGNRIIKTLAPHTLDIVYKLVRFGGRNVLKRSAGKATLAGKKQVFRKTDSDGQYTEDIIAAREEAIRGATPLLVPVVSSGKRCFPHSSLPELRKSFHRSFASLPSTFKQLDDPPGFPVRISNQLQAIQKQVESDQA